MPSAPGRPGWSIGLDGVLAGSVVAFAWWTLIYEVVVGFTLPIVPAVIVWIATAPFLIVPVARWNARRSRAADRAPDASPQPYPRSALRPWLIVATVVATGAAAWLMAAGTGVVFDLGWAVGMLALGLTGYQVWRGCRAAREAAVAQAVDAVDPTPAPRSSWWSVRDVLALVIGVGLATFSLFAVKLSSDDVYYVNLSTWIAEHGRVPLRDTMFGDQVSPTTYGGGFPIASIEALIGGMARLVGLRAGTVAFLIVTPLGTLAAVWVLWQLASLWARHRAFLVFVLSVVFVAGAGGGAYRNYWMLRMWQGKVVALAILVPLIWIFATRLARTRDRHWIVMLLAASVAFVGLTSTAAILGLLVAAAIGLAAVLLKERALFWGAVALGAGPVAGGLSVALFSARVGGNTPKPRLTSFAMHIAFGASVVLTLIVVAAFLLAPLLVRGAKTAVLIWCGGLVTVAVLTPGVFALINNVTGSGPIQWRLLLSLPMPTVVAMSGAAVAALCAEKLARPPRIRQTVAIVLALGIAGSFTAIGNPYWARPLRVEDTPSWKLSVTGLANVRAIVKTKPSTAGPLLLPPAEMGVLSVFTTRYYAVVPRRLDLGGLNEPAEKIAARKLLLNFVTPAKPNPAADEVAWALELLNVPMVCLSAKDDAGQAVVEQAGYSPFKRVGRLRCATYPR